MRVDVRSVRRRATLLSRWYPREWGRCYGEEFLELLVDDLQERPHSLSRSLDVARNGLLARVAVAGLGGRSLHPDKDGRRSLAAFVCAAALFVTVALAIWAQLTIGWQWSAPDTVATTAAMFIMTVAVAALGAACVACAVPVACLAVRNLAKRRSMETVRPLTLVVIGLTALILGTHHFANGWPGTGGHPWAHQGIVPGGVAAYAWASTLFLSSYWLHPAALTNFPAVEVAWMFACPLALASVIVGVAKLVRRLESLEPNPALRASNGSHRRQRDGTVSDRFGPMDIRRRARPAGPVSHRGNRRHGVGGAGRVACPRRPGGGMHQGRRTSIRPSLSVTSDGTRLPRLSPWRQPPRVRGMSRSERPRH